MSWYSAKIKHVKTLLYVLSSLYHMVIEENKRKGEKSVMG